MSAYGQDQLVTKTSVILSKPDDWELWLLVKRDIAERHDIWPYVDPSLSADELPQLKHEKPKEKPIWKFIRRQLSQEEQEDIDIEDLSDQELSAYNTWTKKYEREAAIWQRKQNAVKDLNIEIIRTVDAKHLNLIINCRDPYSRLTTLKKHLCLSVGERNRQLRIRYQAVCTRPKKASLDTWLDEWVTVARLLQEAGMPKVNGNRAQEDFILSIRGLDNSWAAVKLDEMITKDQEGEQYMSTANLVAKFRSYYQQTSPVASSLGTFATLGVAAKPDGPTASRGSTQRMVCLCGDEHRFKDCPYINHSLRPRNWRPNHSVQRKFDELRQQSRNLAAKALRRVESQLKKDGKLTEDVIRQSTISMDDGQPVRSTTHCNAMLQTTAIADQTQPPLLTRWILDPGEPTDYVYAGGVLAQIEEWGEVVLNVSTPTGQSQMKLTYVAYIPGFFTSVVGLSRSRPLGVHFDSGRDCLYQEKASNVICLLQYQDGHWLINNER
ncbi:hypothetical protein BU25DRAFT_354400, partial [Macroventuria anomochaeta]